MTNVMLASVNGVVVLVDGAVGGAELHVLARPGASPGAPGEQWDKVPLWPKPSTDQEAVGLTPSFCLRKAWPPTSWSTMDDQLHG